MTTVDWIAFGVGIWIVLSFVLGTIFGRVVAHGERLANEEQIAHERDARRRHGEAL